jgi:ribosome-binding factor A
MSDKQDKIAEQIRELAADFFQRESNGQSLITITSVEITSRGGRATIRATVLPEDKEEEAIEFMRRKLHDFREYVTSNSRIGRVPFFDAEIDVGEKNRQRIDEIDGNL